MAEILYGSEKMISTRRLARILVYCGLLISGVKQEEKSKYIAGTLFCLGGLLKFEARNYLETKRKY